MISYDACQELSDLQEAFLPFKRPYPLLQPGRLHKNSKAEAFNSAIWEEVSIETLLYLSDEIFQLSEEGFLYLLPTFLGLVLKFHRDERIGNIFDILIYRLEAGSDRAAIAELLSTDQKRKIITIAGKINSDVFKTSDSLLALEKTFFRN